MESDESAQTAAINGLMKLPQSTSPFSSTGIKRKRDPSTEDEIHHVTENTNLPPPTRSSPDRLATTLKDLIQLLSKHDAELGAFQLPLPPSPTFEPDTKRPKLSEDTHSILSIESRVAGGKYQSLQEFVDDVDTAVSLIVKGGQGVHSKLNSGKTISSPSPELVKRTRLFKECLDGYIRRTASRDIFVKNGKPELDGKTVDSNDNATASPRGAKAVLTFLGDAPRGKQLFSSLQQSKPSATHDDSSLSHADGLVQMTDAMLPNGITVAKLLPLSRDRFLDQKPDPRTFGEVFAPRPGLPTLGLPPTGPVASNTSSMITWRNYYDLAVSAATATEDKKYFYSSNLPAGHWVRYDVSHPRSPQQQANSSQSTPKTYGSSRSPFRPVLDDNIGLFRGVYSSFAPSYDSSGSIVPQDTQRTIWRQMVASKRWCETSWSIPAQENDSNESGSGKGLYSAQPVLDESTLEEDVNSWIPSLMDDITNKRSKLQNLENSCENMDDVIQEVSDLLDTLNSYRQLRQLGIAPPGDILSGQPDSTISDSPSAEEMGVYEILKSSLSAMIAILPPYAVSKLNGEQLAELNISKRILVENTDYHGTLEVDEYTAKQRETIARARVPAAGPNRTQAPNIPSPGPIPAPYQRASRSRNASTPNYQSPQTQATAAIRYTPHKVLPHTTLPQQQHQVPRPSYGPAPIPKPPPAPSPYTRAAVPQSLPRTTPQAPSPYPSQRSIPSPVKGTPQTPQFRPPQPVAQGRTPQDARYSTPVAAARNSFPSNQPGFAQTPMRPPYSSSPSTFPQTQFSQKQTPNAAVYPGTFPPNQTNPTSSLHPNNTAVNLYSRTAAEQTAVMEQNKAQLESSQRQNSSTPSPILSLQNPPQQHELSQGNPPSNDDNKPNPNSGPHQ